MDQGGFPEVRASSAPLRVLAPPEAYRAGGAFRRRKLVDERVADQAAK